MKKLFVILLTCIVCYAYAFDDLDIVSIKTAYAMGVSIEEIAISYDTTYDTIYFIVSD